MTIKHCDEKQTPKQCFQFLAANLKTNLVISPSFAEFKGMAGKYNVIPVWTKILADLTTPVALFNRCIGSSGNSFQYHCSICKGKIQAIMMNNKFCIRLGNMTEGKGQDGFI